MNIKSKITQPPAQCKYLFSLRKDVDMSIFELFDQKYSEILCNYCKPLSNVTISIYTTEEKTIKKEDVPSPYSYSITEDLSAEIVFDKDMVSALRLTQSEQMAAVAHEIGHILFQFLDNKDNHYSEEFFADEVACKLGLTTEILSVLCKLEDSGLYTDALNRFGMRKIYISSYCKGNDNIDGILVRQV